MRVNVGNNRQTKSTDPRQSVYDGRERCGDIQKTTDGFVVRNRHGEVIGTFPTPNEAMGALFNGRVS